MAIDSRDKRSAAIGVMRPFMRRSPLANSTIDAADRKHLAFCYAGIAATVEVTSSGISGIRFTSEKFISGRK